MNMHTICRRVMLGGAILLSATAVSVVVVTEPVAGNVKPRVIVQHATSGDQDVMGVAVMVGTAAPNMPCSGVVRLGHRTESLPRLVTGKASGRRWHWQIARGAPAGVLRVTVTCTVNRRKVVATDRFDVRDGAGPKAGRTASFIRIIAQGTIGVDDWTPPVTSNGGSGSSSNGLYPPSQCTAHVSMRRPDLPFFPGRSGDALEWAHSAAARGWPVDGKPQVGDVVVFQPGQYGAGAFGHVGFVETAGPDGSISISETNFVKGTKKATRRTIKNPVGLEYIHKRVSEQGAGTATNGATASGDGAVVVTGGQDGGIATGNGTVVGRDQYSGVVDNSNNAVHNDNDNTHNGDNNTHNGDDVGTVNNGPVATAGQSTTGSTSSCSSSTQILVRQVTSQTGTSGTATSTDGGSATSGDVINTTGSPGAITVQGCGGAPLQSCAAAVAAAIEAMTAQWGQTGAVVGPGATSGSVSNTSSGTFPPLTVTGCSVQ